MTHPACFESEEQYQSWLRWSMLAQVNPRKADGTPNFCQDCTACFQRAMIKEGRCAYPETKFARVKEPEAGTLPTDHEIVGYQGEKPTAGDYLLSKVRRGAVVPVSRPPSQRKSSARAAPPQPSPAPAPMSDEMLAEFQAAYTEPSAPPEAAPGTEPAPAQS